MKKILLLTALGFFFFFAQVDKKVEVPYIAYEMKDAKGLDSVQANCTMCHSFGYILNQGSQSRQFWNKKVHKMIKHFKAPISRKDTQTITNYLFHNYGNGKLK